MSFSPRKAMSRLLQPWISTVSIGTLLLSEGSAFALKVWCQRTVGRKGSISKERWPMSCLRLLEDHTHLKDAPFEVVHGGYISLSEVMLNGVVKCINLSVRQTCCYNLLEWRTLGKGLNFSKPPFFFQQKRDNNLIWLKEFHASKAVGSVLGIFPNWPKVMYFGSLLLI